jgi:hypothetical protein
MAAIEQDITIEQGVTSITTIDTTLSLSGTNIYSDIKIGPGAWKVIQSFDCSIVANTKIILTLPAIKTSLLMARGLPYSYDVFVYPSGESSPIRVAAGKVYVIGRVTSK